MTSAEGWRRWEERFDDAVRLVRERRLGEALDAIDGLRIWQHRGRYDHGDHSWHDAELLWLRGLALERARRGRKALDAWGRLADLLIKERRNGPWILPICSVCASRQLGIGDNWHSVAKVVHPTTGDRAFIIAYLQSRARLR